MWGRVALLLLFALPAGCERQPAKDAVVEVSIVERLPHDPRAFTQGLVLDGEVWLESTGGYGTSSLREVEKKSGKVLRNVDLPRRYFGEGLALHNGFLYQLTWQAGECIVYNRADFKEHKRYRYQGEGWGLCSDGAQLFMSDGSSRISVRDPETFRELRGFHVKGARGPVTKLNELEMVRGELWANIWQTGWIVRIAPADGRVIGFLDLRAFPPKADHHPRQDVLNGIAWDAEQDAVWITGKNWKALYRVGLAPDS